MVNTMPFQELRERATGVLPTPFRKPGYENPSLEFDLYVGNIPYGATENDLYDLFRDFNVQDMKFLMHYAFLKLASEVDVHRAQKVHDFTLKGRRLMIGPAAKQKAKTTRNGHVERENKHVEREFKHVEREYRPHQSKPSFRKEFSIKNERISPPHTRNEDDLPPPLIPAFPRQEDDDLPPPLIPAFSDLKIEDDDLPPPLEPAFPSSMVVSEEDDLPPPLIPAFPETSSKVISVIDCFPVTLVVANFPFGTTEDDLLCIFKEYEPLKVSVVVNQRLQYDEKTYAYVTVPNYEFAEAAISAVDNMRYNYRQLIVTYILERVNNRC